MLRTNVNNGTVTVLETIRERIPASSSNIIAQTAAPDTFNSPGQTLGGNFNIEQARQIFDSQLAQTDGTGLAVVREMHGRRPLDYENMNNLRELLNSNESLRERFFSNLVVSGGSNNLVTSGTIPTPYITENVNNTIASILLAAPDNLELRSFLSNFVHNTHRSEISSNIINLFMYYVGSLNIEDINCVSLDSEDFRSVLRDAYDATEYYLALSSIGQQHTREHFLLAGDEILRQARENIDDIEGQGLSDLDDLNDEAEQALAREQYLEKRRRILTTAVILLGGFMCRTSIGINPIPMLSVLVQGIFTSDSVTENNDIRIRDIFDSVLKNIHNFLNK